MKNMTRKINRGVLLIFIISICFNVLTKAQGTVRDSVTSKEKAIAYGTLPDWMVTSAISTVTGIDLQKTFTSNLANTMFGRISGLTVTQSGNEPGADSPTSYIRGVNTYGSGKSILIIVDGVENYFEQLVPDEIESVSVLKDAAATAIYGSRGANGVMLITTKRGKMGPMKVSFSTQQGFNQAQRLPQFLGSYDYARLYNEALANNGKPARYNEADLAAYSVAFDPARQDLINYPDVNWYDQILRKTSPQSNYNLNFSGGNSGVQYFVLLNALTNNGLMKPTGSQSINSSDMKYSRYNFRTNVDITLNKNLSAVLLLGGSIENKAQAYGRNTSGLFNAMATIPPNAFPIYNPNHTWGGTSTYSNPLGDVLNNGFYTNTNTAIQTSLRLTEKLDLITEGLSVSGFVSFNNFYSGNSDKTRTYPRYSLSKDVNGNYVYTTIGSSTSLTSAESMLNQWRNTAYQANLNYDRTFGIHKLKAVVLFDNESYSLANSSTTGGSYFPYRYTGLNGRFTYANSEKYIAEVSFAYNASEMFAKDKRWGFFPAASLGWVASKEDFLKDSKAVNYLKFRASYGLTGNDQIATGNSRFFYNPQPYSGISGYIFGTSNSGQSSMAEGTIYNPDITWEKEKKLNIGFEATLFSHFDIGLDVFQNKRSDILSTPAQTVPQYLGFILPNYNIGKTTNQGLEAKIRFNTTPTNALQFFAEANVWYSRNKIDYKAEPAQAYSWLYGTGQPIDQPFYLQAIGFFINQGDINTSPKQPWQVSVPGDIKYKDLNNDGIIDQKDYSPIGYNSRPEITLGFETGLKYKGFDLNAFFQAVTNRSVYLSGLYYQAFQNNGKISTVALNRWTPATAETATYPRLSAVNDLSNFQSSSFWVRDGSFIKLRSLELGYNLSKNAVKKLHLTGVRFFINGTNLFSIDHMDFTDPETLSGYPAVRTYSIGTRIQF
jgi:TonB-linked SusC/RagA family outer membrane protein